MENKKWNIMENKKITKWDINKEIRILTQKIEIEKDKLFKMIELKQNIKNGKITKEYKKVKRQLKIYEEMRKPWFKKVIAYNIWKYKLDK